MDSRNAVDLEVDQETFAGRWDEVPLYRWWRRQVVGKIDHGDVISRVAANSGLSPTYVFMILMSAGIAILGLLQSSPAVVIGAMLISPLMSPILGLGFALAVFDFAEVRRSFAALAVGILLAIILTVVIVFLSPLKAPTAEILARTRPNLFDLVVALFSALAGTYAVIRGRGETIVGVAIATALMPPLAVVGYGLATLNIPVLFGATALFVTNFVTIALTAMFVARLFGFGQSLSRKQTRLQTALLITSAVAMAIPLAFALDQIASESLTVRETRRFLTQQFGSKARVTQLDVAFDQEPIAVRSVVIAPRSQSKPTSALEPALARALGQPVTLQVDQILVDPGSSNLGAEREALQMATAEDEEAMAASRIAQAVATIAGVAPDDVIIDPQHHRAVVQAKPLPGLTLAGWRALETRASASAPGWSIGVVPPLSALPTLRFADGSDSIDSDAQAALALSLWAVRRWNVSALGVPGLPDGEPAARPRLNQRRALAVADAVRKGGVAVVPAGGGGQQFALVIAPSSATVR